MLQKLTSRVSLGQIEHNGRVYPGKHEAIIDEGLWNEANRLIKLHAPTRKNPKRITKHIFILQGLLRCGWCDFYMTPKYSTGKKKLHPYYQCTRNSHGGKDACNMKYVPAAELENAVIKKLKQMSHDKKLIKKIVNKANESNDSILTDLKKDSKIQENKLKPIQASIDNVIAAICKGIKNKSVSDKLRDLEIQKEEIEKDIRNIDFEINQVQQQVLSARVMYESLTKFRQIYEKATSMELKELLPRFIEKIIWKPTEIEIAIFNQETQREQLNSVTTKDAGALEFVERLPGLDSNQQPPD